MTDALTRPSSSGEPRVDGELIRRLARGDTSALADLYARHGRAVFSLALRVLEDGGEAEAVAYDVLAGVGEQAARLDPQRVDLGTWLLLATRRRALERRRSRELVPRPDDHAVADLPESSATQDGTRLAPDAVARLRTALTARPLLERLPIELAYFHGLTHAAIASHLEMRPDLVRARIRRGLAALRGADEPSGGHEEALELATLYALGAVSPAERRTVQDHLEVCLRCVQEVRALLPIVYGLARTVPLVEPPETLRARLLPQAPSFPAPQPASPGPTARPRELEAHVPEPPPAPEERPARRGAAVVSWLLALLALAVAGTAGWYAAQVRQDLAVTRGRAEDLASRASLAEAQVTALRRAASQSQAAFAILGAPDLASVDLHGQGPAPQAAGRLFWSRTHGLFITAVNLPPTPPDRAYQIWFVPPTGGAAPVSVGQVRPDGTGRLTASVTTPPDLPTPLLVFLTVEPLTGASHPSSERYLTSLPAPPTPAPARQR
jgi:RNA polymerase sigma-70 factor (ECF subfamily)